MLECKLDSLCFSIEVFVASFLLGCCRSRIGLSGAIFDFSILLVRRIFEILRGFDRNADHCLLDAAHGLFLGYNRYCLFLCFQCLFGCFIDFHRFRYSISLFQYSNCLPADSMSLQLVIQKPKHFIIFLEKY